MTPRITQAQKRVLEFIHLHISVHGMPPTRAEIRRHFGWSSDNSAEEHIQALKKHGMLDTVPGTARGLRITTQGLALCGVNAAPPISEWPHGTLILPVVDMEKVNRRPAC